MKKVPVYVGVQALQDSGVLLRFVVEVSEKNIYSHAYSESRSAAGLSKARV